MQNELATIDNNDIEWVEIKVRSTFLTSDEGFANFCADLKARRKFTTTLQNVLWKLYKKEIDLDGTQKISDNFDRLNQVVKLLEDLASDIQDMASQIEEQDKRIQEIKELAKLSNTFPEITNGVNQTTQQSPNYQQIEQQVNQMQEHNRQLKQRADKIKNKAAVKQLFDSLQP